MHTNTVPQTRPFLWPRLISLPAVSGPFPDASEGTLTTKDFPSPLRAVSPLLLDPSCQRAHFLSHPGFLKKQTLNRPLTTHW